MNSILVRNSILAMNSIVASRIRLPKMIVIAMLLLVSFQVGFTQLQTIEIRENQTSHLIFPADILYTDIGDNDNFIVGLVLQQG